MIPPLLEAFFNAIIVPLMIYEMIPENSCSAVSIASFLFILALISSYYKRMLEYSYKIKENQNPKNSSYFSSGN